MIRRARGRCSISFSILIMTNGNDDKLLKKCPGAVLSGRRKPLSSRVEAGTSKNNNNIIISTVTTYEYMLMRPI